MIKATVTNKASDYWGQTVLVSRRDWKADSFWVAVAINGRELLMSRHTLQSI